MKPGLIAMSVAAFGVSGCAFARPMASNSAQTTSHVRILPNTAVKQCRANGPVCEPPSTTYQGHFSGHVDAFGDVILDPPDGLPPQ